VASSVEIPASRRKVGPYLGLTAAFVALFVYLAATNASALKFVGLVAALFLLVALGRTFVSRSAVLTIDDTGLRFQYLWGSGNVVWPEIEACSIQPWGIGLSGRSTALALVLRDPRSPRGRLGARHRRWARRHGFVPVSLFFTDAEPDVILGAIRDFAAKAGVTFTVEGDGRALVRES
jgi:hypothetical protein